MLDGARVVPIAPSPRVRATSSPASQLLVERRVQDLLPQTTQRAQARLAALKYVFVSTTAATRHARQRRVVRDVLERIRLTKTVRNVSGVPAGGTTSSEEENTSAAGTLCLPFTCCAALATDGLVVTGAVDGRLTLWDVCACRAVATQLSLYEGRSNARGFRGRVCRLTTHPSLPLIVSTTMHESTLTAWRVVHEAEEAVKNEEEEETHKHSEVSLHALATSSSVSAGEQVSGHAHGPIRGLAMDPTGNVMASAACDGTLCVWDLHTLRPYFTSMHTATKDNKEEADLLSMPLLYKQEGYESVGAIRAVSFHPDGALLTTGDDGGRVVAWDIRSGKVAFTTAASGPHGGHLHRVRCVAWSPCGIRFASGGDDAVIHLWDARRLYRETMHSTKATHSSSAVVAPYMMLGHSDVITSLSFYSDPQSISYNKQGTEQTQHQTTANSSSDEANMMSSSVVPIGLISTSLDHSLRIWDADTGLCVRSLDAGTALYDHCRPLITSTTAVSATAMMNTTPAAIFTVGHHKYWSLWDCIADAEEDGFAPAVHETALVARADQLTAATEKNNTAQESLSSSEEEEESEEDEMMALRRPAAGQPVTNANNEESDSDDEDEDDEDEMALLRVKRTKA